MSDSNEKYAVLHIEGGLGKNVAASAIIKPLAEKHKDRKLIVVCSWPEIFLNNPHIHRVYSLNAVPYFYDDYINRKDTIVFRREPYFESTHIMQQTPLMQTWFSMCGLEFDERVHKPEIHLNMYSEQSFRQWLLPEEDKRPILVMQTNGGPFFEDQQQNVYSWTRDMPYSLAVDINNMALDKGYFVYQICRPNSPILEGAQPINEQMNNIDLFSILKVANRCLLIDSCMQHAAAAFKIPATVLWCGTHPEMFGYKLHNNIIANKPTGESKVHLINSHYFDYNLAGIPQECPYKNETEIFNKNKVLSALKL